MEKLQFRVLYRQFLFRMVDLELLSASAQGDISKLLGQFAGLLVFFSFAMSFGALIFDRGKLRPAELQAALWGMEHFLISTTMLVVGLFAVLSWDSTFPDRRDVLVLAPLARRAWIGLAISLGGTAVAYAMSYFRTLKKIVEEPDIVPGTGGVHWLPPFGDSLRTAVVQFSIRTLSRSRQHRVMLAFFLGIGFSLVVALLKANARQHVQSQAEGSILFATVIFMLLTVVGVRVVFSMPLALRANWIFRVTQVRDAPEYMSAIRRTLLVLAVVPVWATSAAILLWIWTWRLTVEHLVVLALLGMIATYICVAGFRKIPFTCSYLPGKSYVHMVIIAAMGMLVFTSRGIVFEMQALHHAPSYCAMVAVLILAAGLTRWRAVALAKEEDAVVQFEEVAAPAIQGLGLNRDGVVTTGAGT